MWKSREKNEEKMLTERRKKERVKMKMEKYWEKLRRSMAVIRMKNEGKYEIHEKEKLWDAAK